MPAETCTEPRDRIPFERRRHARKPEYEELTASFTDTRGHTKLSTVQLVDSSPGGLGIIAPVAVEPGSLVLIYGGRWPAPYRGGVVRRCERREGGTCHVGVESRLSAAA